MLADLLSFLVELGKKLQSILYWFTDKIYDAAIAVWNWIIDACCYTVEILFSTIDFKNHLFDVSGQFAGLPSSMIYIMNQIGIDNFLLIITTAIIIRVSLNLIPGALTRV